MEFIWKIFKILIIKWKSELFEFKVQNYESDKDL